MNLRETDTDYPEFREHLLELLKVNLAAMPIACEHLKVMMEQTADSFIRDQIILRVEAFLAAEQLGHDKVSEATAVGFKMPANPWQHFKMYYSGAWWLRWAKPIKWVTIYKQAALTVDLRKYMTFPEAPHIQGLGPGRRVMLVGTSWEIRP